MTAAKDARLAELMRLYRVHGSLTASLVLEESRDPAAVLHNEFQWDDTVAAEAYRLTQAGNLIRSVKFKPADPELPAAPIRAFVSVRSASTPSNYQPVERVSKLGQSLILAQMRREIEALRERYGHLSEFWQALNDLHRDKSA